MVFQVLKKLQTGNGESINHKDHQNPNDINMRNLVLNPDQKKWMHGL